MPKPATSFLILQLAAAPLRAQCPDGTPPPCGRPARGVPVATNSVAVLAFENRSRDSSDLYLTEGFQDEVSSRLTQVQRLVVISPGVVRRLPRAAELPLDQVGPALHARHLVMGSFQRSRDRLRVNVQLVRAQDGVQLWSQSYDTQGDALEVQSDVALRVATAILARLLPGERTVLEVRQTRNAGAWDHFQRGNHYLAARRPVMVDSAIQEYEAAVGADSTMTPARARVAYGYALMRFYGSAVRGTRGDSLVAIGLSIADDALRRDSSSSDGWMARAYLLSFRNPTTYDGVREAFERSVRLDPRNAEAWHQYGGILGELRYDADALRAFGRALALEPGRAITYRDRATLQFRRGDLRAAKADSDSGLALDSTPQATHERVQLSTRDTMQLFRMLRVARQREAPNAALRLEALLDLARGDTASARAKIARLPAGTGRGIMWLHAGMADSALAAYRQATPGVRQWAALFDMDLAALRQDTAFLRIWRAMRPPAANPAVLEGP